MILLIVLPIISGAAKSTGRLIRRRFLISKSGQALLTLRREVGVEHPNSSS
jgi:hypothetical protein